MDRAGPGARRLGLGQDGLRDRLDQVLQKAYRLGSPPQVGLTDPWYVHTLVRHGYITVEDGTRHLPNLA